MIKAGFARIDVTPPLGTPLAGYFSSRISEGVLDPLQLNAVAFGSGEVSALLIVCDLIGVTMERADVYRAHVAAATGVDADHILLTSLHQHTSIYIGGRIGDAEDYALVEDVAYLDVLQRKFCDVARMAIADMSDARLFTSEAEATPQLSFTRRYVMEDGSIRTNPAPKYGTPVRRCDASDNAVRVVRFERTDKKDIVIANFSTHPDVIGGKKISADWPGFTRRFVEGDQNVHCICMVGCQGDSNHVDFIKPKEERLVGGAGLSHSAFMGRTIADTVAKCCTAETEHTGDTVFGGVKLIYNRTSTAGEEHYDEAKQFMEIYERGEKPNLPNVRDVAYAMRTVRQRTASMNRAVPVSVLAIGDVAFVGFGGEPFTHYGTATREGAPDKTVLCACCANGYEGYLLTDSAFAEGGYEAATSLFTTGLESQCVGAALEMLSKI